MKEIWRRGIDERDDTYKVVVEETYMYLKELKCDEELDNIAGWRIGVKYKVAELYKALD